MLKGATNSPINIKNRYIVCQPEDEVTWKELSVFLVYFNHKLTVVKKQAKELGVYEL